mmetsp:Transcript_40025/g.100836  ORF Transcript_40025/g.100836 Transcript_40025/m.100836 type:complete len:476 (-) Transcript_40025:29-1456(-)|eukprot:CAMPEP_0177652018 /NCGR_PEP_ID=MMETSP0447-20121125/12877_1 /TAXON_ID=0 /ORGANISM="Stygamoeba regulata, Strain BSH-02190019" /LENGTH=475 /DNA_ID=CAMNT_0019155177 /DNA_START=138 /DNA_END=1565 /DNA_ORIENTATION=-
MDFYILILWAVMAVQVFVCPLTKVEESFNLQAMHDITYHVHAIDEYDHLEFPGVVPRTFVGPLAIVLMSSPVLAVLRLLHVHKFVALLVVRLVLGTVNVLAFNEFRRAFAKRFGQDAGRVLLLVTACQFHLPFYMSRTLPNSFALCCVLLAFAAWMRDEDNLMMRWLAFAAVIFRSELVLLLGPLVLQRLVREKITFFPSLIHGIGVSLVFLACTVLVDSVFWQRWLWPEGEVFWFNTFENKSHLWGVAPFHWYFSRALPKALLGAAVLMIPAINYWRRSSTFLMTPVLIFVSIYSLLPHKELRFIFYVIPLCNAVAALGFIYCWRRRNRSKRFFVAVIIGVCALLASVVVSSAFLYVSSSNYPGGRALQHLHDTQSPGSVHIDVAAAQTGISRFLQLDDEAWSYSKAENLSAEQLAHFDYLVTARSSLDSLASSHELVHSELGFDRLVRDPSAGFPPVRVQTVGKIFVWRRMQA